MEKKMPKGPREDIDPQSSTKPGFIGWYERRLRRFKRQVLASTLVLVLFAVIFLLGLCAAPAVFVVTTIFQWTEQDTVVFQTLARGIAIVMGYFTYGFSAILIVPLANRLVLPFVKPFRGPYYSVGVFGWYLHNMLTYLLRYTFLELITPTPFSIFFYRSMGMKIGPRVEINTTNISDPGLITLEEGATIGGSATIIAHYAASGYLIIAPVIIRKGATLGLRSIVMGGVEIGEGAKVLPNSVVMPKTIIPAGETWGGVPARKTEEGHAPSAL